MKIPKPGWFKRQLKQVEEEIKQWPSWMREQASFTKRKNDMNINPNNIFNDYKQRLNRNFNKMLNCPFCKKLYRFYAHLCVDQSCCPTCRLKREEQVKIDEGD